MNQINKIKSVSYYWYHHQAVNYTTAESINRAIQEHDWKLFNKAIKMFGSKYRYQVSLNGNLEKVKFTLGCDFPDYISVDYEDPEAANKANLPVYIPLNKKTFQFITFSEYECG